MQRSEGSGSPARMRRLHLLDASGLSCRTPGREPGKAHHPQPALTSWGKQGEWKAACHRSCPDKQLGCNWAAQLGSWEVSSGAPKADNIWQTPVSPEQWVCLERMIADSPQLGKPVNTSALSGAFRPQQTVGLSKQRNTGKIIFLLFSSSPTLVLNRSSSWTKTDS